MTESAVTKKPADVAGSEIVALFGAAAKSGLNRSISERAWGKTLELTKYKAQSLGKLVICVPPYTSQMCPICGHRSKENRPKQALFACTNPECRFNEDHALTADQVAAMNIAQRAVDMLISGEVAFKKKKRTLRMRRKSEGGLKNQGRDGAARTSMRPEKAAKPVEPEKVSVTADQKAMKLEAPPNPSAVKQRTDWVG